MHGGRDHAQCSRSLSTLPNSSVFKSVQKFSASTVLCDGEFQTEAALALTALAAVLRVTGLTDHDLRAASIH